MKFETVGDAYRYCKENGFDISMNDDKLFDIAQSIRKLKVDQDIITRHDCAEELSNMKLELRVWDVQKEFYGKLDMLMILDDDHIEVDYEGHTKEPRRVRPEEAIVEQCINGEWIPVSF